MANEIVSVAYLIRDEEGNTTGGEVHDITVRLVPRPKTKEFLAGLRIKGKEVKPAEMTLEDGAILNELSIAQNVVAWKRRIKDGEPIDVKPSERARYLATDDCFMEAISKATLRMKERFEQERAEYLGNF